MRQIASGLLAATLVSTTAMAEEARRGPSLLGQARSVAAGLAVAGRVVRTQAPAAEPLPVKVTGGVDFPSHYFFRGIRQEFDPQLTIQPFVNLAFTASETTTVNVGSWNSFHTGTTKDAGDDNPFYESDFYVSAAFAAGAVTPTVMYTAYMSPNDLFGTVHELAFLAAINDGDSTFPLAPAVTVAFELGDNGADAGAEKGVYLELAATPAIPMGDDAPVTLTVPVKLGMSLKDYYEHPETGEDSKFGYFSIGLMGLVPLSPNVDVHGGVTIYTFGETLEFFNNGDKAQVVGSIGLGFSF
jgi:hypothetical protein